MNSSRATLQDRGSWELWPLPITEQCLPLLQAGFCHCCLQSQKPAIPATTWSHKICACIPPVSSCSSLPNQSLMYAHLSGKILATCLYSAAREAEKCLHTHTHTANVNILKIWWYYAQSFEKSGIHILATRGLWAVAWDTQEKTVWGKCPTVWVMCEPPSVAICSVGLRWNGEVRNACVLGSSLNQPKLSSPFIYF